VRKYVLLAASTGLIFCPLPTHAWVAGNAVRALGAAAMDLARPEPIGWFYGRPDVSCNLRIPCPFPGQFLHRGRHYARYRGDWVNGGPYSTTLRNSYRPCPADVMFPNGRHACLGLP
jgi:hypothetical protein